MHSVRMTDCLAGVVILRHAQDQELNAVTHSAIVSKKSSQAILDMSVRGAETPYYYLCSKALEGR